MLDCVTDDYLFSITKLAVRCESLETSHTLLKLFVEMVASAAAVASQPICGAHACMTAAYGWQARRHKFTRDRQTDRQTDATHFSGECVGNSPAWRSTNYFLSMAQGTLSQRILPQGLILSYSTTPNRNVLVLFGIRARIWTRIWDRRLD
jgi:hypothetical protein